MSTPANERGWGPGWPNCQKSKMVTIHAGGIALVVRAEVAPIFKGFCDDLVTGGYPLGAVADDWGFACRPIRGTENRAHPVPSNHSWGLAIDLNSTHNPMGAHLVTDFPAWAVDLGEKKYHLGWGGRYTTRPDSMHWEWLHTPADAAALIAALGGAPSTPSTPTPHPQEIEDMFVTRITSGPEKGKIYYVIGGSYLEIDQPSADHLTRDTVKYLPLDEISWAQTKRQLSPSA